jgi:hypothetical protein
VLGKTNTIEQASAACQSDLASITGRHMNINTLCKPTAIAAVLATGFAVPPGGVLAAGAAQVGPLFEIATGVDGGSPLIARGAGGSYVAAWSASGHANAQTFNADGTPASSPFQIALSPFQSGHAPLAMDKDGDFVSVWFEYNPENSKLQPYAGKVYAQRYASDGAPQGTAITVASVTDGYGLRGTIQVAMDDDGDFAVAWTERISHAPVQFAYFVIEAQSSKTYAKVYKANGQVRTAQTAVNKVATKYCRTIMLAPPVCFNYDVLKGLAMNGKGDLVMVFDVERSGAQQETTSARTFNLQLKPLSNPLTLTGVDSFDGVGIDAASNFSIAWNDSSSTYVSRYSVNGASLGTTGPIGTSVNPTLSVTPAGAFAVTWDAAGPSGSSFAKHAQYFNKDGTANGAPFLIDDGIAQQNLSNTAAGIDANGNLVTMWTSVLPDDTDRIVGRSVTAPPLN